MKRLIEAYEEYIAILHEELMGVVSFAVVHGWVSSLIDKGAAARVKIENIKKEGIVSQENIVKLLNMITEPTECSKCHRKIWFVKMKSGKTNPIQDDGISHFAACPYASSFRKKE